MSSPITLLFLLVSRLAYFKSDSDGTSSCSDTKSHLARGRQRPIRNGSRAYLALSFSDGPVIPPLEQDVLTSLKLQQRCLEDPPFGKRSSGLRPLSLVDAKNRAKRAAMIGRCLSPTEEGDLVERW